MNSELRNRIADLLREAGSAHHEAFIGVDGSDPDWPIWYADYLRDRFAELLEIPLTRSRLVYCLMQADMEYRARSPDQDWATFYADNFLVRCTTSESFADDSLALYHSEGCPFCIRVRSVIDELGIDVELRDIFAGTDHRDALVAARGRATVPVLRITSPDGEERWMPESADIVAYLRKTYS